MLNPDFHDILSAFCDQKVDFLLVGAYALAAHGLPRATGDIDLWVKCSPQNAGKVMRALALFVAPLNEVSQQDFETPGIVFQIGVVPRRVDIITAIDGVAFDEAWPDRLEVVIENLQVPVIGKHHLARNKRACGRPKDLVDLAWLEEQGP